MRKTTNEKTRALKFVMNLNYLVIVRCIRTIMTFLKRIVQWVQI